MGLTDTHKLLMANQPHIEGTWESWQLPKAEIEAGEDVEGEVNSGLSGNQSILDSDPQNWASDSSRSRNNIRDLCKTFKKKKKRTPGTDWLDVTLIKIVANFIASALCHDLNQSFTQSTCPQSWKNS